MKLQISKFNKYSDKTGKLVPFYLKSNLKNFKLKRFFFLYGNKKYPRADHAHRKCNQIIIPIFGSSIVQITKSNKKKYIFNLSTKNKKYLFVPKNYWIKINFKRKDSISMILCDYKYDKAEYIQDFKKFIKKI